MGRTCRGIECTSAIRVKFKSLRLSSLKQIEKLPTARWKVIVEDRKRSPGCHQEEEFDAIMVCIGHHSIPKMPEFRDRHLFQGRR